ncbi:hypothetical protein M426DRAFT_67268 [Hypoxylon sp. CI-4A]|nr:hypothetical protein M426DRAFT_67268 [Hypoxylon sp. CI-4A]
MFSPSVLPYFRYFYPIGNTPAVSLTRDLPQGVDADILLLGCGDVRNILFTAYSEQGFPSRKFDITCCDFEPAVIARNVLLFTLILDGVSSDRLWDIYFYLRIDEDSRKVVREQAQKIASLSSSIDQWTKGPYGSVLKFCDAISLQQVGEIWSKYASTQSKSEAAFEEDLKRTQKMLRLMSGHTIEQPSQFVQLTGLRSAAPLSLASRKEVPEASQFFWKHGSLSKQPGTIPNPLFSETLSANTYLHYGTDPILGFHLATAFANLAPTSPLRPSQDGNEILNIVKAAKTEFREWIAAFQGIPQSRINLRFSVSDCLLFSNALQIVQYSASKSTSLFRQQFDTSPIEFDLETYGTPNSAPTTFDVIDTSNLADHFGALNLLVAAAPLLKSSASSTLWVETLLKTQSTRQRQFDVLLRGHAPTISLLLGLSPVDYWTNATSVSCVDEQIINAMSPTEYSKQAHSRLAWKLSTAFSNPSELHMPLNVEHDALSNAVFQVYLQMFENEDPASFKKSTQEDTAEKIRNSQYTHFHRGSFVSFIKHVQASTSTDWPSFWKHLLQLIDKDSQNKKTLRNLYRQDFGTQLHLQGLHTETWVKLGNSKPYLGGFNAWKSIPPVVCVTVVVPREQVNNFYINESSKVNPPALEGVIRASHDFSWHNLFGSVHFAFGDIESSGNQDEEDFSIIVRQDPLGWQGQSPLIASFYAPSITLQVDPNDAIVGLNIQNTPMNIQNFKHLLPEMSVYTTTINDASHIFVTKYEPGMSDYPFGSNHADTKKLTAGTKSQTTTAKFENGQIKSLCGHYDFPSGKAKKLLADRVPIELQQSSPFSIDIVFDKKAIVQPVYFPAPVVQGLAKSRVARTSGYIEVIAPLAEPSTSESSPSFIYPIVLGKKSLPMPLNSSHINLDSLPILDVDEKYKKSNNWLNILTAHQFSVRERRQRESGQSTSLRLNFKESLFTMFMLASGLQGGTTGLFALGHPTDGNQMLLFIRAIRINGSESSVVADAAVLPFTHQLIESGEIETFLYVLRELEICSINVNDEELALWKNVLPSFAERCRTWSHGPKCEYKRSGATIPLSTKMGERFMCTCGNGKIPRDFISLPEWEGVASKHAIRIALTPTFAVPFVEDIVDLDLLAAQGGIERLAVDKCRCCSKTEGPNGAKLLRCARCRDVSYCSAECQRKDWKKHRAECKA